MNSIDKILAVFDDDYRYYMAIPDELCIDYPSLSDKRGTSDASAYAFLSALVIFNYCFLEYSHSNRRADILIGANSNIRTFLECKYRDGGRLMTELDAYYRDYMAASKNNGYRVFVPNGFNPPDMRQFFAGVNKAAFPFIHAIANFGLGGDFCGDSTKFVYHYIRKVKERCGVYEDLLSQYCDGFSC